MRWRDAVLEAVIDVSQRLQSPKFTRKDLIQYEIKNIVQATEAEGSTPEQTLSRELQNLRNKGVIEFLGRGEYQLLLNNNTDTNFREDSVEYHLNNDWTTSVIRRPKRDPKIVLALKKIYGYRCQICNTRLELPSPYAEAHHTKPLGFPHFGPDVLKNLLIVCPNHHVLLDYGAILIRLDKITIEHEVSFEFVEYHNQHIYKIIK
jgi:predicted HNH restriction endonuclease